MFRTLIALSLAAGLAGTSLAQAEPVISTPVPATQMSSQQFDFTSAVNGRTYRVTVARPFALPPKEGYPVVYVLDGGAYFSTFASAIQLRSALGGEIAPAVVVGIGYPSESMIVAMTRRSLDLTPSQPSAGQTEPDAASGPKPEYAGADDFFKVIDTEIRPQIAKMTRVAPGKDVLFGHSLGGLFVLHTLFTHPDAFDTYLALSPSIWWANRAVLKQEAAFSAQVVAGKTTPKVFIGVGGLEQTAPEKLQPGQTREQATKDAARFRMVGNATDLARRLAKLKGASGYVVQSKVFPDQSHMSVPWEALNTMVNFALPPN